MPKRYALNACLHLDNNLNTVVTAMCTIKGWCLLYSALLWARLKLRAATSWVRRQITEIWYHGSNSHENILAQHNEANNSVDWSWAIWILCILCEWVLI